MKPWLTKLLGRGQAPPVTRALEAGIGLWGLEAGAPGRGDSWQLAGAGLGNASLSVGLLNVRRKSQFATINCSWLANGTQSWVTSLVGSGITVAPGVADETARADINARFAEWAGETDGDAGQDFYGFQASIARGLVVDGEAFVYLATDSEGDLRPRLLQANQVDLTLTRELGQEERIINGIEFNTAGDRVAYWTLPVFGLSLLPVAPAIRIPAADMCHVYRPLFPGQVRGIPWSASCLLNLRELDELQDAQLMAAKVASMFAGFIQDQNATTGLPFDGHTKGSILDGGLEPGTVKILPSGYSITFSEPAQVQSAMDLSKLTLRSVAAGLGIPAYLCDGDLSGANYSSLRAGLVEFRSRVEAVQYHQLIPQCLRPIYRRWLTLEILARRIDAPGFEANPESWLGVNWYPPGLPWVDPLKDAEAEVALIAAGLKSRRQAVAERGYDVAVLDAEIAEDKARELRLGLNFSVAPPVTPPGAPVT